MMASPKWRLRAYYNGDVLPPRGPAGAMAFDIWHTDESFMMVEVKMIREKRFDIGSVAVLDMTSPDAQWRCVFDESKEPR